MTFADFAIREARFRKHYRMAPADTWNEQMVPLHEFLELAAEDRDGRFPFIWSVDRKQQLARLIVDRTMVESCEDRRSFWRMLRSLAGLDRPEVSREAVAAEVRREIAGELTARLMKMAAG